jgi:hypothetical protein
MKRSILIILLVCAVIFATGCNYNGKASIKVRNVGTLDITIRVQGTVSTISPGEEELFELEWPGHADQQINYIVYPRNQPEKARTQILILKDGDNLSFDEAFYPE